MKKVIVLGLLALASLVAAPAATLLANNVQQSQIVADGSNDSKPGGG
jgi:hypothetical protein